MSKNSIKYIHWKTKEDLEYNLDLSSEENSSLICPFDQTDIVLQRTIPNGKNYFCPNCGLDYEINSKSQEEVNNFAREYYEEILPEKLKNLKQRESNLIDLINHSKKQGKLEEISEAEAEEQKYLENAKSPLKEFARKVKSLYKNKQ